MVLFAGFSLMGFIRLRKYLSIPGFLSIFIINMSNNANYFCTHSHALLNDKDMFGEMCC